MKQGRIYGLNMLIFLELNCSIELVLLIELTVILGKFQFCINNFFKPKHGGLYAVIYRCKICSD